ncbi:MAG: hypothetical protein ACXAB7_19090 [Candidatus Kariarchaeaceae archaeon]|jgi:hypothetical protein
MIKDGFLRLPDIGNIKIKPTDPYDLPTVGRLHSVKFEKILLHITDKSSSETSIKGELEGHLLQDVLGGMKKSELADFCRHTIIANKNYIGWQNVDTILDQIDQIHVPSWDLPDFKFDKGFREIFSTIIKWDFEPHIEKLVKEFIDSGEMHSSSKHDFIEKMKSEFHYWSLKELWLFYDNLVTYCNANRESDGIQKFFPLQTTLTNIFKEQLDNPNYSLYQKVALSLIFTKVYVNQGRDEVRQAEELIDKRWREIEKLSQQEITSFRYLFGASFSIIGFHVFQSQTNFIMRRRLLGRLITNFIQPKELDIQSWFNYLIEADLHPLVLEYIFTGYSYIIPILNEHSAEFPVGETRQELLDQIQEISLILQNMAFSYLTIHAQVPHIDDISPRQFMQYLEQTSIPIELKTSVQKILISTIRNLTHLDDAISEMKTKEKYVELGYLITKELFGEAEATVFSLDTSLKLDTYPFERIFNDINRETEETLSIILSKSFEDEIIKVISTLMDYLLTISKASGNLSISSYEVILCYAGEWLQYFLSSDQLYNEALMVIAPIISICYVQIARGYFERNMTEKAFLTYINMYYFVELFMDEIKQSSTWRTKEVGGSKGREDITNRFDQMISDWNFKELLDIKNIQKIVVNMELSLDQLSTDAGASSLSGMLEDDVIFGYLDLTKGLENFIEQEVGAHSEKPISDQLHESELYRTYDAKSYYRFNRLGFITNKMSERELPFPIIRNVNEMAIAISMFPLQRALPGTMDSKLYQSFTNIFTFDQDNPL